MEERNRAEVERLRAMERDARWSGAGLGEEDLRRVASFQQSFNEMGRGERFVQDHLRARARERQRWWVGLPALAASALALLFLGRAFRRAAPARVCRPVLNGRTWQRFHRSALVLRIGGQSRNGVMNLTRSGSQSRDGQHRHPRLQPHLEDRSDHPLGDRHRFLQAAHGADDLEAPSRRAGHLRHPQPHDARAPRRHRRCRRAPRAARPLPHAVADARRIHLAARQHLLRQAADVRAGFHRLARGLPLSRIPARETRRAICPDLSRALGRDDDVGDSGPRRAQRAAFARRHPQHGQVRARRCSMPAP